MFKTNNLSSSLLDLRYIYKFLLLRYTISSSNLYSRILIRINEYDKTRKNNNIVERNKIVERGK